VVVKKITPPQWWGGCGDLHPWLGGTDAAEEGTWVFEGPVEDKEKNYMIFSGSQPDNNGNGEHCLELVWNLLTQ